MTLLTKTKLMGEVKTMKINELRCFLGLTQLLGKTVWLSIMSLDT